MSHPLVTVIVTDVTQRGHDGRFIIYFLTNDLGLS